MNRGDIYLVSLEPTSGHEQQGSRPVLIVSPTPFNLMTKLPIICPITTEGEFAKRNGFAVPISGIKTNGVDQLKHRGQRLLQALDAAMGDGHAMT